MYEYSKVIGFIFDLCGNEFTTQILLTALLFIPVMRKRSLFYLRYPLCFAAIIGLQTLKRFGYFPVPDPVNYALVLAMIIGTTALCFHANLHQSLFLGVCIYCGQFVFSSVAYVITFIVMRATGDMGNFVYYYVIMPVVTVGFCALIYFFVVRYLVKQGELKFNNLIVLYCVFTFVFVATTLTHYARLELFWSIMGTIYLLTLSSLFTCSTLLVGFMNITAKRLEEENAILQEILHKDEQRYEQAKLSNEKIMIKYHDLKQFEHHGVVDYESLKEVETDSEILNSAYFTGNRALDIILSEKALMCERLGIRFICTADGSALDFMKPYHIYSLVGNALENAIESIKGEVNASMKEIYASITRHEGMCVIKTVNYISSNVEMREGLPITLKEDSENHGFGAKSMKNVVTGYGGQISFYQDNDMFTVIATMPLPS